MNIRDETESDHPAVERVVTDAFGGPAEARLVEQLRRTVSPAISLVADVDGAVVGHAFFSPVTLEKAAEFPPCGALAPVAVATHHQHRGIGSALIEHGVERCRGLGWSAIFLVGDPLYYRRFGFQLASSRGFHYASYELDSAFQLLELEPGALDRWSGWIRYPEAFDAFAEE